MKFEDGQLRSKKPLKTQLSNQFKTSLIIVRRSSHQGLKFQKSLTLGTAEGEYYVQTLNMTFAKKTACSFWTTNNIYNLSNTSESNAYK